MRDSEYKKYFVENALQVFEKHLSEETGFIHFDENKPFEKNPYKASIYHSFLFVVALFRAKNKESILKAQKLLKKLLKFQSHESGFEGSFPKYLHEYPFSYDRCSLLDVALCLNIVISEYDSVIEKDFLEHIKAGFIRLMKYLEVSHKLKPLSQVSKIRLKALLGDDKDLLDIPLESFSVTDLSQLVLAVECLDPLVKSKFYQKAAAFLHPSMGLYIGKQGVSKSYFGMAEKTLFERACQHVFSLDELNTKLSDQVAMKLSLVTPVERQKFDSNFLKLALKNFSLNALKTFSPTESSKPKLLDLHLLSNETLCSLVCEEKKCEFKSEFLKDTLSCEFVYPKEIPDDGPNQVELSLFFNDVLSSKLFVEEVKATVFHLGERVKLAFGNHEIELTFSLLSGEGRFIGQISKGNRPSDQTPIHGEFLKAYDWTLSIRTLFRGADIKLKLEMKLSDSLLEVLDLKEQESLQKHPLHEDHCQHKV